MTGKAIYSLLFTIPLWTSTVTRADVTVRYESDVKMSPPGGLPAAAENSIRAGASRGTTVRMKNGKSWCAMGKWTHIVDYTTQQMTIVDTEHKTFSKLPMAELGDRMSALLPQPKWPDAVKKMMEGMKTTVDSKRTGRADTILGIQAEETETVLAFEIPGPSGGGGFTTKIVMQVWNAKAEETLRNQAVREFTGYNIWSDRFMNPVGTMEKMFGGMPGFGDTFKVIYDTMAKSHTMQLRMRMAMFMQMPAATQKLGVDPDAPVFQMTQEAVEVSSAPVEESIFQIPADYWAVPAEELLKNMVAAQTAVPDKQ